MNKPRLQVRAFRILAAVACSLAVLFVTAVLPEIVGRYRPFYSDLLEGQPLPSLTLFVLQVSGLVSTRVWTLVGVLLAAACLVGARLVSKSSPSEEQRSVRLLMFFTILWIGLFGVVATVAVALAAPLQIHDGPLGDAVRRSK